MVGQFLRHVLSNFSDLGVFGGCALTKHEMGIGNWFALANELFSIGSNQQKTVKLEIYHST